MRNAGRRYQDGCARWEGNNESKFPEDEVATAGGIEIAKGGYGAPSKCEVVEILVLEAGRSRPKIHRRRGPCSIQKVVMQIAMVLKEGFHRPS